MKKIQCFLLIGGILLGISSCMKHELPYPHPPTPPVDSTTSKLIANTWVYYEYFYRFDSSATSLAFKTGRSGNTLDLVLNKVKFNANRTYTETDENGNTFQGTWSFLNNETQVQVVNSQGTFTSTIQKLTGERYEWFESGTGHYGIMVPNNLAIDTTGGRLQLLTSKTWIYDEYFFNYSAASPALVWKTNKANSTLNLSLNVVKFNTDGTYSETDQYGTNYNGTWTFLNNQTEVQVNNVLGTFTSTIQRLDSARYEWLDSSSGNYGEMIPR